MDANLVVYGADGQREGSGQTSYFVTIAKNLTIDGWVVIGICMAMLVVALAIMIVKAFFLSRVEKANARFLKEFRRLSGDATALDSPATEGEDDLDDAPSMASLANDHHKYGASTLYRLYHHGVRELNKRIAAQTLSAQRAHILSAQSIDAIRAAMDGTMTRLQQSLSSQMVLLTIAISGGPFLGLLGTVIGVMITFAAIALSGDVNVPSRPARRPRSPPRWPAFPWPSPLCSATTGSTRASNPSPRTTGCSWTNSSRASPNSTAEAKNPCPAP
jgi:biopolymer transport protein ExbB